MASVTINGNAYEAYTDVAAADLYLAADAQYADAWAGLEDDPKGRNIVSATRLLLRQKWVGAVPDLNDPPPVLADATALLAAMMIKTPALAATGSASSASNIKSVGAGSAKVEFFASKAGTVLPLDVLTLLGSLLGYGITDPNGISEGGFVSGSDFPSRFDCTDYTVNQAYR